jgi:RNA polymerase sigma-B factor
MDQSNRSLDAIYRQYARNRDPKLRELLVLRSQNLIRSLAARFQSRGEALEDLILVGNLGLLHAMERFNPEHNVQFVSFAVPTIVGEIKRYFRDRTQFLQAPRSLQELAYKAHLLQQSITARTGKPATVPDLADELAVSEEQMLEALEYSHARSFLSLDYKTGTESADDDGAALAESVGAVDGNIENIYIYDDLRHAMRVLPAQDRNILYLRFFENLSQATIAQQMGVSQIQISRMQNRALKRLRGLLEERRDGHQAPRPLPHLAKSL